MRPRGGRPLPVDGLADETQRPGLRETVALPTLGQGRGIWPLGDTEAARAAAWPQASQACQRAAQRGLRQPDHAHAWAPACATPATRSRSPARASLVRQAWRAQGFALGQRLRHCAAQGQRGRQWCQAKKAGWSTVLADPPLPGTSTLRAQAHNAIEGTRGALPGFHHPGGSPQAWRTGLAPLSNLVPSPPRAPHAGQCGVAVEGGRVPPPRLDAEPAAPHRRRLSMSEDTLHHVIGWNVQKGDPGLGRRQAHPWAHAPHRGRCSRAAPGRAGA